MEPAARGEPAGRRFGLGSAVLALALGATLGVPHVLAGGPVTGGGGPPYALDRVQGMQFFAGSEKARRVLARQGFVVTGRSFRDFFEAYKNMSGGVRLPLFITVDTVLHAYHVLLEESVTNLERWQARRLREFSRRLYAEVRQKRTDARNRGLVSSAGWWLSFDPVGISPLPRIPGISGRLLNRMAGGARDVADWTQLARFVGIGMVLQGEDDLELLEEEDGAVVRSVVRAFQEGRAVRVIPEVNLRVPAKDLRAEGPYAATPELRGYFAARRWYAKRPFPMVLRRQTVLALRLVALISGDHQLSALHRRLTDPYADLLGPADDPSVREYASVAHRIMGTGWARRLTPEAAEIVRLRCLRQIPPGRISDQYLPGPPSAISRATTGFRLLPPIRTPLEEMLQRMVELSQRPCPPAFALFAAGPLAPSTGRAAARLGEWGDVVLRIEPPAVPESLHGRFLHILSLIQEPLSARAPASLRGEAWGDKQLWTAMGALCEQHHTWALHSKKYSFVWGLLRWPRGYVSPYPRAYRALAALARDAAQLFGRLAPASIRPEEAVSAAFTLCDALPLDGHGWVVPPNSVNTVFQISMFAKEFAERPHGHRLNDLEEIRGTLIRLAKRWKLLGRVPEADVPLARVLVAAGGPGPLLLPELAELCDRLAEISDKELAGAPLSRSDEELIVTYGERIARLTLHLGNDPEPRDDVPVMVSLGSVTIPGYPEGTFTHLMATGRPKALYVVVEWEGVPVLHRGAVLTYHELCAPGRQTADDEEWRREIRDGYVPSAPAFTEGFLVSEE